MTQKQMLSLGNVGRWPCRDCPCGLLGPQPRESVGRRSTASPCLMPKPRDIPMPGPTGQEGSSSRKALEVPHWALPGSKWGSHTFLLITGDRRPAPKGFGRLGLDFQFSSPVSTCYSCALRSPGVGWDRADHLAVCAFRAQLTNQKMAQISSGERRLPQRGPVLWGAWPWPSRG